MKVVEETTETVEHPMEQMFDIVPGSTTSVTQKVVTTSLIKPEDYDDKDGELDKDTQTIVDAALTAYQQQVDNAALIDPKYQARALEVAQAFLTTALEGVKVKVNHKQHKDKLKGGGAPRTVNNNLVVASRRQILKRIVAEDGFTEFDQDETSNS